MRKFIIGVLLVLFLTGPVAIGQGIAVRQAWEYALMFVDTGSGEYTLRTSQMYEAINAQNLMREETRQWWDIFDQNDDAALIDYLAVMGIAGFELIDIQIIGDDLVYHFKRPVSF